MAATANPDTFLELLPVLQPQLLWFAGGALTALVFGCLMLVLWRLRRRKIEGNLEVENLLLSERLAQNGRDQTRLEGRLELLEAELARARVIADQQAEEIVGHRTERAALQVRLEETARNFAEKEALLRSSGASLKQEFELLANRIFEKQGERHQEKLTSVLLPFREQIGDFRKRVEEVYHSDGRDRASLLNEVRNLQRASEKINLEAGNLTKALKGDVKLQGNWGELVLERVLEDSGLRSGHEYFLQETRRTDAGDLKRPDVLIRLPDDKDVVIDAKVSLIAYERALSAAGEADRDSGLKQHVASVRSHVRRLADQDYAHLDDVRSLDFVLLFIPIEAAFTLVMEADAGLFSEAFRQRIVIVSPTTLMMTLRIIHNVWRYEKQNRNAQEIAQRAGALYDKLRGLVEDLDVMGRQLKTVEKSWEAAYGKVVRGKGNLVRQVEQFRELGAQVRRPLPKSVTEEADASD
ncbi:MAG: DNA recombination protein RmuC [Pseudomonadales bacterium]